MLISAKDLIVRRKYLSSHHSSITNLNIGCEPLEEWYDRLNALKGFFKLQRENISIKSLLCPVSWIYKQFDSVVSVHLTDKIRN